MKKSEWLDCQRNEFFPKQKGIPSLVKIEHKNTATLDSARSKKKSKVAVLQLHLIVEYRLSPLTIMGRMGETTRVENRGETTRGERTRGETSWGRNVLLPFWAGPPITKLFLGPTCSWQKNVSESLISKHTFTYTMFECFVSGKKFSYLISSHR